MWHEPDVYFDNFFQEATEDQTVVKMVDEEGLEQNVVEETTSLTKEAELEDKYMDKPEPVKEDNNNEGVYKLNLAGILFKTQLLYRLQFQGIGRSIELFLWSWDLLKLQ